VAALMLTVPAGALIPEPGWMIRRSVWIPTCEFEKTAAVLSALMFTLPNA
jgi:hypothetical protein